MKNKKNRVIHLVNADIVVVFYINYPSYFIMDKADYEALPNHVFTAEMHDKGILTVITVNGKRHYLHRWLLNPASDMQVDHINRITRDNRRSNLRPATPIENQVNTEHSIGCIKQKGNNWILTIPPDTAKGRMNTIVHSFDSARDAQTFKANWLRENYNEFAPNTSMELAKINNSHLFDKLHFYGLGSEKLTQLPDNSMPLILMRCALRDEHLGLLTKDEAWGLIAAIAESVKRGEFD